MSESIIKLTKEEHKLQRQVRHMQITGFQRPTWLAAPLTSVAWDGDAYSTTAKTVIDLSAVFGAPANIKAALFRVIISDSGSAAGGAWLILSPNNTAGEGMRIVLNGVPNDQPNDECMLVPCDANGDVYYQIAASGAGTMDVFLQVWSYWL